MLLRYIDKQNLPEYLGGTSKATLLDDAGPWNDSRLIDAIDADLRRVPMSLMIPIFTMTSCIIAGAIVKVLQAEEALTERGSCSLR